MVDKQGFNELALFAGAGGVFLQAISLDGEQSAQSNGKPIPQAYCAPDKMTAFSRLSRFGMTFKPLMEDHGEELLMSYREAFPVKTSQPQVMEQESPETEAQCGSTWRELLGKYDPNTSLWKTAQCSLLEDLELSLEIWPRWGSMRNGECFRQTMLAQTTSEREFGFWATPTTMDKLPPKSQKALMKEATIARPGRSKPANLRDQVSNMRMWPTPMAKEGNGSMQFKLTDAVEASVGKSMPAMQKNPQKWKEFQMWPTPVCQDSRHAISRHLDPQNNYWKSNLGEVVMSMETENTGRLNPTWVEWLMGWPTGWTDLKPLEMDRSHCAPQPPLNCSKSDCTEQANG